MGLALKGLIEMSPLCMEHGTWNRDKEKMKKESNNFFQLSVHNESTTF